MAGVALGGRIAASLLPSHCRFGCFGFSSLVAESYLEGVRRRNCVVLAYIPLELWVFPRCLSRVCDEVVGPAPTNSLNSVQSASIWSSISCWYCLNFDSKCACRFREL
jgi:hypothetical protein